MPNNLKVFTKDITFNNWKTLLKNMELFMTSHDTSF